MCWFCEESKMNLGLEGVIKGQEIRTTSRKEKYQVMVPRACFCKIFKTDDEASSAFAIFEKGKKANDNL